MELQLKSNLMSSQLENKLQLKVLCFLNPKQTLKGSNKSRGKLWELEV